ncbi:MAG: KH domain-containing protein [Campylobacterales bacterium]|nr:KH domain-containing protein [Campylobacterales bacterium]
MVEQFVERFAALLSSYPEEIRVEKVAIEEGLCEIIIYANQIDAGKIIGKEGKMINALKTVISGCKAKDNISYKISVKPNK